MAGSSHSLVPKLGARGAFVPETMKGGGCSINRDTCRYYSHSQRKGALGVANSDTGTSVPTLPKGSKEPPRLRTPLHPHPCLGSGAGGLALPPSLCGLKQVTELF